MDRRNFLKTGAANSFVLAVGAVMAGAIPGTDLMTQYSEIVRDEVARRGTCRDEFVGERGDGWENQLYVREGRQMVGEYVMTEQNCRGTRHARRSVALAAYQMDSHHVRRYVDDCGFVRNEGDVQFHRDENGERFPPYPID